MKKYLLITTAIISLSVYSQEYIFSVDKEGYKGRLVVEDSLTCELTLKKLIINVY